VKKPYQAKRQAAEQFAEWAKSNEVPIQLTIPATRIAELTQQNKWAELHSTWRRG
jgi:hypothetical protein